MAPRPPARRPAAPAKPSPEGVDRPRSRLKAWSAVGLLLALHYGLAAHSLLQENATVDETLHLPAGLSYWETGSFALYHHNPPLVKLIAALPLLPERPKTDAKNLKDALGRESQAAYGQYFALENVANYFELFDRARLVMPLFTVLGGLVVFAWSSRLYGNGGGLLGLSLWCLCPNVLAHGRLITSDAASAAIGAGATYLFWRYQHHPGWGRVVLAGLALGVAQLTKFSLILLYGFWPALAVVRFLIERRWAGWPRRLAVGLGQWAAMVALSVLVIDVGYGFEGVGTPLGKFEFASLSLTAPVPPGMTRPTSQNDLLARAWQFRINRFRGTILGVIPSPLPRHYLLGFDDQKLETEGIPRYYSRSDLPRDDSDREGYMVYLDGQLRRGGWWYYYLATLAYKVPEGTWVLVVLSGLVLVASRRSKASWSDEATLLVIPVGVLGAMSFLTDICLGLRYVLAIFPYGFIAAGKVVPWAIDLAPPWRWPVRLIVGGSLLATATATASVHPHYLSYFNWSSGGPDRGSGHLIDSNLDWGQDLVTLDRWVRANRPGVRVGLAYFGQINPTLLRLRGGGFEWFLPPVLPGRVTLIQTNQEGLLIGPAPRLTPGLYAVSASIVRGLSWRLCDPTSQAYPRISWLPAWDAHEDAFAYFRGLTPVARVGHSIYVYDVTGEDCARLAPLWSRPRVGSKAEGASGGAGSRVDLPSPNRHDRAVDAAGHEGIPARRSTVGSDDSVFRRETDDDRAVSRELDGDPPPPGHPLPVGEGRLQRDGLPRSPDASR